MTSAIRIRGIGVAGPGLDGWSGSRPVLSGQCDWSRAEVPRYSPQLLPPNERRRATPPVRLSFRAAEDALSQTALDAARLATVFASSDGDLDMVHKINEALARPGHAVSPTDFHNSVHNAPAGYWSIAVGARGPSSSVAAHDASFAAGLLEAAVLAAGDGLDTLFAAYDTVAPFPLGAQRPVTEPFAVALLLSPDPAPGAWGTMTLARGEAPETMMDRADLEALRRSNPAARALPLLECLARGGSGAVHLPAERGTLTVIVDPS